jgi:type IV fimbrial biogenesis protein FimT
MDEQGRLLGHSQGRELLTVRAEAFRAPQRGVSLIEMMTAIAIFTILSVMAFPIFTTWIANQQVRTATESVVEGLRVAQSEALKRNSAVRFVLDPSAGWEAQLAADDTVLKSSKFAEGTSKVALTVSPVGTTTVLFDGLGRPFDKDGDRFTKRVTIDVDSSTVLSDVRKMRIVIDTAAATGVGIRTCDPKLGAGDPRACPA